MTSKETQLNRIIVIGDYEKIKKFIVDQDIPDAINYVKYIKPAITIPVVEGGKYLYRKYLNKDLNDLSNAELLSALREKLGVGFPISLVDYEYAQRNIDFGVGKIPKDGCIYIQHPIIKNLYCLPEEFPKIFFDEKESAFLRLAASLGAKEISLISIETKSKKGFFGGKSPVQEIAAEVGAAISFESDGSIKRQVFKSFNRPKFLQPYVPEDLKSWVSCSPDLRIMSSDRLEANVAKSQVKLSYSQGLGLDVEVIGKLSLGSAGISSGYKELMNSTWVFNVEYYDL